VSGTLNERRAFLVDRHPLWLDVLEQVVSGADVEVIGKTTSSRTAERRVAELKPELLITELALSEGECDGIALVRKSRELVPSIKTIVLSNHEDQAHVDAAFAAGADAYVVKSAQAEDVTSAVRQAFNHSVYLSTGRPAAVETVPARENSRGLTRRELEMLKLVAEGQSNAQVARALWVTEQTVKFHLSNIYRKLDVSNRTEASRWAQLHGLLNERALGAA
jgi:two-component system response regulator DevR